MVKLMKSTLPQFSNETDWEMAAFELILVLDRTWPHKQALVITEYLRTTYPHYDKDMERRADSLIYFALTLSAKKDSYARLQIMAASHPNAIPCVLQNEGHKLFKMFQSIFTMTTRHAANLPSMRKQFHDIKQLEAESVLAYTSRVDLLVANMAKLGEQISTGMWIYTLGNGLRPEYKDTKDGILYSKDGYDSVILVKSKIQNEDAILKDSRVSSTVLQAQKVIHDEIAMKGVETKSPTTKSPKEQAQFHKGKDGKKGGLKGQRQWVDNDQWTNWKPTYWDATPSSPWDSSNDQNWSSPLSKGKGKQPSCSTLWFEIHQAYGHSTDWCFKNPNKTGGPPKQQW